MEALFLLGGQSGAIAAGIVMLFVGAAALLQANFMDSPLDWPIRKGDSQNVWARVPAADEVRRRVLLVGHLDTHRTPWVFTSPQRLAFFRLMTTLAMVGLVGSGFVYLALAFLVPPPYWPLTLVLVPVYLGVFLLTWQPDTTPYTHGANDNASGAAIVMSLAGQLATAPLPGVEVWALCTGCEEVGAHGMRDFLRRRRQELRQMLAINLDNVGGQGAGVCYITTEGMVIPLKPAPELLALAGTVGQEHPEFNAYAKPFTTLGTDASCLMVNKIPALSFVGLRPDGTLPHWHQASDVFANVDPQAVETVEAFVMEMLKKM